MVAIAGNAPLPVDPPVLIDLDLIDVDHSYQKPENRRHVAMLVDSFNPTLVGVLQIAGPYNPRLNRAGRRLQRRYRVWDGQHRLQALKQLGYTEWYCMVTAPNIADEANLFYAVNTTRWMPGAIYGHKALLTAKDPTAQIIENTAKHFGRELGANRNGGLPAVQRCYDILNRWGEVVLHNTLYVTTTAWGDARDACAMPVLSGVGKFLGAHGDIVDTQPKFDDLAHRLQTAHPDHLGGAKGFWETARRFSRSTSGTKGEDVYAYTVDIWNKGRHQGNRITAVH